jgi:hypothetical protein
MKPSKSTKGWRLEVRPARLPLEPTASSKNPGQQMDVYPVPILTYVGTFFLLMNSASRMSSRPHLLGEEDNFQHIGWGNLKYAKGVSKRLIEAKSKEFCQPSSNDGT